MDMSNMTDEQRALIARLETLEAENAELKSGGNEPGLPVFEEYDKALFLTVDDAVEELALSTVDKLSVGDVRSMLRLFNLEAAGQYKPDIKAKGRGANLYMRGDFDNAIRQIEDVAN